MEIQKIMNTYFENLYSHRVENTEEMHRFLETYELPKLNQEHIAILNSYEIETVIKNLPTKKSPGPVDSQLNSTRNLEKI